MSFAALNRIQPGRKVSGWIAVLLFGATIANGQIETVTLKNGKAYEVETRQGMPVGFKSDQIKVTNLVFRSSTEKSPKMEFVWLLAAELRARGKFLVTVTTPLDDTVSTTFQCKGPGKISQGFFDSAHYPALWVWLEEPGATWIPFMFSFEEKGAGKKFEATQWVKFDSATKSAFRKHMKQAEKVLRKEPATQKRTEEENRGLREEPKGPAPSERVVFDFDGREWHVGYSVEAEIQRVTEFVLPGETVDNWKELVTTQAFPGAQKEKSADEIALGLKQVTLGRCPKAMWRVIHQDKDESLYEWQTTRCRGYDNQYEVAKIIRGRTAIYRVAYTNRKLPISDELRNRWLELIRGAKLDTGTPNP
jgi:hypothetical protein